MTAGLIIMSILLILSIGVIAENKIAAFNENINATLNNTTINATLNDTTVNASINFFNITDATRLQNTTNNETNPPQNEFYIWDKYIRD